MDFLGSRLAVVINILSYPLKTFEQFIHEFFIALWNIFSLFDT